MITPPVERLRDALGLPGMLVLQFGFEPDQPRSVHRLANHVEHRFVYIGTHDHDTALGWWSGWIRPGGSWSLQSSRPGVLHLIPQSPGGR